MKVCKVCRVGRLSPDYVPYLHLWDGQIMVIPNVPALVCDTCQHTEHDPAFMDQIDQLIHKDDLTEAVPQADRAQLALSQMRGAGIA